MVADSNFEPDITTSAIFLQARTAIDGEGEQAVLPDFEMLDFRSSPTTVGLRCSIKNVQKVVHSCLRALESFGDQPASVLLKVLNQDVLAQKRRRS
jgi:hypothetical protein